MITSDPEERRLLFSSMQIALLKIQPLASRNCAALDEKPIPPRQPALLFVA